MNTFDQLVQHFERFPGIGARQAKRHAFHVLKMSKADAGHLASLIESVHAHVATCGSCTRFFPHRDGAELCPICANENRDHSKLLVVEHDSDIEAMERSGVYDGLYFVLGGTIPLLGTQETNNLRGGHLKKIVTDRASLPMTEIILGFSINPDGENTARYVEILLKDITEFHSIPVTHLGRGLSTGSELEYADPETLKNALRNRGR